MMKLKAFLKLCGIFALAFTIFQFTLADTDTNSNTKTNTKTKTKTNTNNSNINTNSNADINMKMNTKADAKIHQKLKTFFTTGSQFFSINLKSTANLELNNVTTTYGTDSLSNTTILWSWGGYGQTMNGWQFGGEGNLSGFGTSNDIANSSVSVFYGYGGLYLGRAFFAQDSSMQFSVGVVTGFGGYSAHAVAPKSGLALGGYFIPIKPEITYIFKLFKHMGMGAKVSYLIPWYIAKQNTSGNTKLLKSTATPKRVELGGLSAGIVFSFFN